MFPRGNSQKLTLLEQKDLNLKVLNLFKDGDTADVDAMEVEQVNDSDKKRKRDSVQKPVKQKKAKILTLSKVDEKRIFGLVKKYNDLDIEVSLPNQLTMYCSILEISDFLVSVVEDLDDDDPIPMLKEYVPEMVICKVIDVKEKKVTLNPVKVNDGLEIVRGLVVPAIVKSKQEYGYIVTINSTKTAFVKTSVELKIGGIVNVQILNLDPVTCTLDIKPTKGDVLEAGMLVRGVVVNQEPLVVDVKGRKVTVDKYHAIECEGKVVGRVVYSDGDDVVLSLRPALVESFTEALDANGEPLTDDPTSRIGSVVEAKIEETTSLGLYVSFTINEKTHQGFIHVSRISDDRANATDYAQDQVLKSRVIGYDHFDAVYLLSSKESIVGLSVWSTTDVKIGQKVQGQVVKVGDSGVDFKVGNVKGYMPWVHGYKPFIKSGSTSTKDVEKEREREVEKMKRRVGKTEEVWVWQLEPLIVSKRKDVISNTEQVKVGDVRPCIVTNDRGSVNLLGGEKAMLPTQESGNVSVGQGIEVRVTSIGDRIRVTMNVNRVTIGTVAPVTLHKVTDEGVIVDMDGAQVTVLKEELADGGECERVYNVLKESRRKRGVKVELGACRIVRVVRGVVYGSLKPFLVTDLQKNTEDIQVGVVSNITEKACFIRLGDKTGIASIHQISDGFVERIDQVLKLGQTVVVKKIKDDQVSLKQSIVGNRFETEFLESLFTSRGVCANIKGSDVKYAIGQVVQGKVETVVPGGSVVTLEHGVGYLTEQQKGNVSCTVVDVDVVSGIVDLKLSKETAKELDSSIGKSVEGTVELVKDIYAVVNVNGGYVYVMNRPINAPSSSSRYKVGQSVSLKITKSTKGDGIMRYLAEPIVKPVAPKNKRTIKNPIDERFESMESLTLGFKIRGKVAGIKETQLNIKLADNVRGRIHATLLDKKYKNGDIIECTVVGFHDARTHAYLPITHTNPLSQTVVELSLVDTPLLHLKDVKKGEVYKGVVNKVEKSAVWVQLSPIVLGRIDSLWFDDVDVCNSVEKVYKEGDIIECECVAQDTERGVDLIVVGKGQVHTLETGKIVKARVTKVDKVKGLNVFVKQGVYARICVAEAGFNVEQFKAGQVVEAMIVSLENEKMELSLNLKTQERSVKVGDVVDGVITGISNNGCFVSLDYMHTGRIKISNISDSYVKEWKSLVTMGKVVKTVVVEIKGTKIECSLKDSDVDPTKRKKTINEFEKGMVVTGSVKRVESFGVFVQIDGSDVVGLCHISQVSDSGVKDLDGFEKGDVVKAFILKVDKEKKKVSLSLQASKVDVTDDMDVEEASVSGEGIEESEPDSQGDSDGEDQVDQDDVEMQKDDEESEKEEEPVKVQVKQPLMLEGFSWDSSDLVNTTPDSDSDSEEEVKKSRRAVKKEKSDKEKMIQEREMQLLDDTRGPEMPEDFERLLLGSPNNSFLWIKYMAFQLELSETDKARQIAERALTIINFREEQERLNILVAYLNLENKFGNEESLEKLFDRACGMADPKKVHIQMVRIFERNDQTNEAEALHKKMCKKFNMSCKIWLGFALFTLKTNPEKAKEIVNRSLKSLPARKHVKIMNKFGQAEYKFGSPERGRTLFEGLLGAYPKRIDLWNIYLDMEIKVGDVDVCRRLFERILTLKWSTKKMQFLFKKYSQFEKSHGSAEGVKHVVQSAKRYLESLS